MVYAPVVVELGDPVVEHQALVHAGAHGEAARDVVGVDGHGLVHVGQLPGAGRRSVAVGHGGVDQVDSAV